MQWYYTNNETPAGPVTDADFRALVKAGVVGPATMVWRQGLPNWMPYSALPAEIQAGGSTLPPQIGGLTQCCQCQRWFPPDEVLRYQEYFVCGGCKQGFFQKLQEGVPVVDIGLWQHGPYLVVDAARAKFPDRCVRCNRPAEGFRLPVQTSRMYNLTLRGIQTAEPTTLAIGVCRMHQAIRRACLVIGGAFIVVLLLCLLAGLSNALFHTNLNGGLLFGGGFVAFVGAGILFSAAQFVTSRSFTDDSNYMLLQGAGRKYLHSLPDWRGRPAGR